MPKPLTAEVNTILSLPWRRCYIPEDGGFTAWVEEFPGCVVDGDTIEQMNINLMNAAEAWIRATLEKGDPMPKPIVFIEEENYRTAHERG